MQVCLFRRRECHVLLTISFARRISVSDTFEIEVTIFVGSATPAIVMRIEEAPEGKPESGAFVRYPAHDNLKFVFVCVCCRIKNRREGRRGKQHQSPKENVHNPTRAVYVQVR